MKRYLIITILSIITTNTIAQVGINNDNPLVNLHVSAADASNPQFNEGVIIPRVTSLNMTDTKEKGLLVFLDNEDPATTIVEKGFYWWDGTTWIPFFSMNKMTKDKTITYVSCLESFREGNMTDASSTNVRTMQFNNATLIANDEGNFEINSNNELVVKKAGSYHVQAVISLNSVSTNNGRDAYEAKILVNNVEPTPNLRTAYGFPSGNTFFDSNSAISGYVELNANDRISIQINRYYRDTGTSVTIRPNGSISNLTLRYLGTD